MAMLDEVLCLGFISDEAWPEEIKNAQYVNLIGGSPIFDPHTKTITLSLGEGGGGVVARVSHLVDGSARSYPAGQRRFFTSDGSTHGGSWAIVTHNTFADGVAANTIDANKLFITGVTSGWHIETNGTSALWVSPSLQADGSRELTGDWDTGDTYHVKVIDAVADADVPNWGQVQSAIGSAGGGTITGVTAGNGLTGGGTTGSVTLDVVAGNGSIVANANEIHVGFDATVPSAPSGSGSTGTSLYPAHADHVHPASSEASSSPPSGPSELGTVGTEDAWARGDHRHEDEIHPSCIVEIPEDVNISAPGFSIYNGQELSGERVFVNGPTQDPLGNNGPWEFNGASSPMTRPSDWTGTKDWSFQHIFPIRNMVGSSEGGVLNGQPSYGYAISTGEPYQATITVGTTNVPFFRMGCPIPTRNAEAIILHEPCFCAAICDIPDLSVVDNTGELFDGIVLTSGMRVFLPLQTTEPASKGIYDVAIDGGVVSLVRSADLSQGIVGLGATAHEITVLNGDRWGTGHRWHYSISGEVGVEVPSVVSLSGRSVVYGQFPASETDTTIWSAPQWSDRARTAIRVRGKLTIDETTYNEWATTYYAWETYDLSALAAAAPTDEGGRTWSTYKAVGDSIVLQATTGQAPPGGSGCWYLQVNSNNFVQVGEGWAYLPLAGGYRYRIRVKAKESVSGMICLSSSYSDLNYDNSYALTTSWESKDFSEDRPSNSYLIVYTHETVYTQTASITYFAHLQIDRRRLYVDPVNNVSIDLQYTESGFDWDKSKTGWGTHHLGLSSLSGNVYLRHKGFARNVDLVIDHQGYSLLDATTVTDPVSQTSPLDYPWD